MGYLDELQPAELHWEGSVKPQSMRRCIVVIGPSTALFQGLVYALRSRFPAYEIVLSSSSGAFTINKAGVSLVLNYVQALAEIDEAALVQRNFPHASKGLIIGPSVDDLRDIHQLDWENGILPLTLELDVWLAAVTVLLSGGSYYPSARRSPPIRSTPGPYAPEGTDQQRGGLTRREYQVLGMLSQGLQNKLIADRLALSEHTVKVHVHNLIRKLHVHNRTQAAACFRISVSALENESWVNE